MQKFKTEFPLWFWNYILAPFSWSKWTDIMTFSYGTTAYLFQGRVNKKTNAKKFRVTNTQNRFGVANPQNLPMEKLTECGLINTQVKFPTDGSDNI